jgi:hypothetical protein
VPIPVYRNPLPSIPNGPPPRCLFRTVKPRSSAGFSSRTSRNPIPACPG